LDSHSTPADPGFKSVELPEAPQLIAKIESQKVESQSVVLVLELRVADSGKKLDLPYTPKAYVSADAIVKKDGVVAVKSGIERAIKEAQAWLLAQALVNQEHTV
jgi:hypothetical protein